MFSRASHEYYGKDLFNTQKVRNATNTEDWEYNCAGFALGTFSWYCPSYDEDAWGYFEEWSWRFMEEVTHMAVNKMLRDFANLRLIRSMREVRPYEYAVAFRVSSDGDFHYMRQIEGNVWQHKPGGGHIRFIEETEVFSDGWCNGRYDGPLVLFAMGE